MSVLRLFPFSLSKGRYGLELETEEKWPSPQVQHLSFAPKARMFPKCKAISFNEWTSPLVSVSDTWLSKAKGRMFHSLSVKLMPLSSSQLPGEHTSAL